MNIIVEGIDKAGKTTLIKDLMSRMAYKVVFKLSAKPPNDDPIERQILIRNYYEMFAQTREPRNENMTFIFDRSYPSEMVYSMKRGYDAMGNKDLLRLDFDLAVNQNTFLLYCTAPKEVIHKRFYSEKEDFAKVEEIDGLIARYEHFLELTKLPFITINSTDDREHNLNAAIDFVLP